MLVCLVFPQIAFQSFDITVNCSNSFAHYLSSFRWKLTLFPCNRRPAGHQTVHPHFLCFFFAVLHRVPLSVLICQHQSPSRIAHAHPCFLFHMAQPLFALRMFNLRPFTNCSGSVLIAYSIWLLSSISMMEVYKKKKKVKTTYREFEQQRHCCIIKKKKKSEK